MSSLTIDPLEKDASTGILGSNFAVKWLI